jgi:NAD(P)-dependent dehydrogenase (short-subunit alcohol dehydrogenase family)
MSGERRKIVVVGAGSGIGAAVATHFHDRGDYVLAVDVREHKTPASHHLQCDLRDAASIRAVLGQLGSGWDMLAHVAGVPGTAPPADVLKVNYLWDQRLEILAGLLELIDSEAVEAWQADQDPNYPVYSTSKQAVILYCKRLAGPAWTKYGVRVNTVSPGPVETPILSDFEQTMGKDVLDMCRATVGRHASVDDIVPVIAFLGSPGARWITGQDIHVDGGFVNSMIAGPPIQL